jgi:NAD(P)-dependent dehydrogenase (short-subunit alcohol dehydrogenase family)
MKTIVITGSSRGIGYGLAKAFVEQGCQVVISGRSQPALDAALASLTALIGTGGGKVAAQRCDVGKTADVEALWNAAIATFGRVDIWINNAGMVTPRVRLDETTEADIDAIVETNLMGVIKSTRVVATRMLVQRGGYIYNFEGFGSDGMSASGLTLYGTTKRAVTYFTKSAAKEFADTPVKIGLISPGIVATDLLQAEMKDAAPAERERSMKLYNILGDRVSVVAPYIAKHALRDNPNGASIRWLTMPKAMGRFMTAGFVKRDIFSPEN